MVNVDLASSGSTRAVSAGSILRTHVEVVADLTVFASLHREWNDLLRHSSADGPFLTWEWLYAWWTGLRGRSRLRLCLVRVEGRLVAVAPLCTTTERLPWFSRLTFLGTGEAGSDYLDLIVRCGFEAEALAALATALDSEGIALRLSHLPPDSQALGLARMLESRGWSSQQARVGACPLIQLAGQTWDSYLRTRSSAHRANVRRRIKVAGQAFDLHFDEAASESRRLDVLNALTTFHGWRWRGPRGSTAFRTPALRAFHHDATARLLEAGHLRLYALSLDGQVVGAMYAVAHHDHFYFYQHGFDERYKKYSLGLVLMALTIRAAIGEGATEFDMLCGVEAYKWLWADDARPLGQLDLYPAGLSGGIHRRQADGESALRSLARRLRTRATRAA